MDYYLFLYRSGVSPYEAYQATSAAYGPPKTKEQLAQEQQSAAAKGNLAAVAGQTTGVIGGAYLGGRIAGLFSGAAPATAVAPVVTSTIPAGASIPSGFTAIGTAANGGTIIAPVADVGTSVAGTGTSAVSSGAGASAQGATAASGTEAASATPAAAYLGPVALAAGAYGAYQTAEQTGSQAAGSQRDTQATIGGGLSGLALGAGAVGTAALAGMTLGSWLGPVGMAVGALAGYAGSKFFGSKKGKAQFMRDSIRDVLQQGNILDDKYQGTLADGSKFDFGQDGSYLKWKEIDKIAAANPNAWSPTVLLTDALAAAYGFVGQKASDVSAWYARAAVSNAGDDPNIGKANAQYFAKQQGITYDQIKLKLDEAIADNRINKSQYDYYLTGAKELTAGITPDAAAAAPQIKIERPEKGKVLRVSPGLYRNDQGELSRAKTMRDALELNYGKET